MLKTSRLAFVRDALKQHTPSALRPLAHDLRQQAQRFLKPPFAQQEWVSREQFMEQQALLEQALKRIAQLEQQRAPQANTDIASLEKQG